MKLYCALHDIVSIAFFDALNTYNRQGQLPSSKHAVAAKLRRADGLTRRQLFFLLAFALPPPLRALLAVLLFLTQGPGLQRPFQKSDGLSTADRAWSTVEVSGDQFGFN